MPNRMHNPLDPRHDPRNGGAPAAPVGRGPAPTGDLEDPPKKSKKRKNKPAPEKSAPAPAAAAGELFENGEADA